MLVVSDHTPAFEGGPFLMLSEEDDVDIHASKRQGMTISEIARRTDHDRKTIRAYLNGDRRPGMRAQAPDPFDEFVERASTRTRTCGRRRCWTSYARWGSRGRIRR